MTKFSMDDFTLDCTNFEKKVLAAIIDNETSMVSENAFSVYREGISSQGIMPSFGPIHFSPTANPEGTATFLISVLRAGGNEALANNIEQRSDKSILSLSKTDYAAIDKALETSAGQQAAMKESLTHVKNLISDAKSLFEKGLSAWVGRDSSC